MAVAVVWGQKERATFLGFAADYCPICRTIQPFAVHRISVVSHIYWVPTGKARPVAEVGTCTVCGTGMPVDAKVYSGFSRQEHGDLKGLIAATHPAAVKIYQQQTQLAQLAARGKLGVEQRAELLSQPFQLLAPLAESLYARKKTAAQPSAVSLAVALFSPVHVIHTSKPTAQLSFPATLCVLVAVFGPIASLVAGMIASPNGQPMPLVYVFAAVGSLVGGIVATVIASRIHRTRTIARRVLPLLTQSLAPLEPTPPELKAVMAAYSSAGYRIGDVCSPEQLLGRMKRPGPVLQTKKGPGS